MKLLHNSLRLIKGKRVCYVSVLLIICVIFFWNLLSGTNKIQQPEYLQSLEAGKTCYVKGAVYKVEEKEYTQHIYIKTEQGRFLIYDSFFTTLQLGNTIAVTGKAKPFEVARNDGNFDAKAYYGMQKIYMGITANKIETLDTSVYPIRNRLYCIRKSGIEQIYKILEPEEAGLLVAMIFGEKNGMDSEQKELYQKVGISHIFAISGLHISLVSLVIYRYIRKASGSFLLAGGMSGIILILYIVLIGMGISAIRAGVMFLMRVGADISGRVYDMKTSLGMAGLCIILINPNYIYDGGFLLSFGAILGVIYVVPILQQTFPLKKIGTGLHVSIGIQLVLYPIMLYFFYEVSLYSVFLNILVLPVMTVLLGCGFIGILLSFLWLEAGTVLVLFSGWILQVIEFLSGIAIALPSSRLIIGQPWWVMIVLYYIVLVCLIFYSKVLTVVEAGASGLQKCYRVIAIMMCFIPILLLVKKPQSELEIAMVDIGQGDCFYIKGPQGTQYLVDGGSTDVKEVGKYRIEPFLKFHGVGSIDYAFISHGDMDHLNGIAEMLERRKLGIWIKNIVVCREEYWDDNIRELVKIAQRNHTQVCVIEERNVMEEGEMTLQCIAPPTKDLDKLEGMQQEVGNVTSMILSLEYGEFGMLFTGDVEGQGERYLEEKIEKQDGQNGYPVLKVAHHGSKNSTSEEILTYIQPQIALISAGINNSYGHPHVETIEKLKKANCQIYTTAKSGGVMLSYNANSDTITINETVKP